MEMKQAALHACQHGNDLMKFTPVLSPFANAEALKEA
jgi:hypothetical protein